MTNETQPSTPTEAKPLPFGDRLRTARESLGLERKDAAAQLRLNEKLIVMMEKDRYPVDLPVTFIRGYIRSYGKLLQIPDYEIRKAIEPIKPIAAPTPAVPAIKPAPPVTSGNYFMQFFTYLIVLTLIGLVGTWWYTHQPNSAAVLADTQTTAALNIPTQTEPSTDASPTASTMPPAASSPNPTTSNSAPAQPPLPDTAAIQPPLSGTAVIQPPLPDTAAIHPPVAEAAPVRPVESKPARPANRRRAEPQQMQPSIMQPPAGQETASIQKPTILASAFNEPLNAADLQSDDGEPTGVFEE